MLQISSDVSLLRISAHGALVVCSPQPTLQQLPPHKKKNLLFASGSISLCHYTLEA